MKPLLLAGIAAWIVLGSAPFSAAAPEPDWVRVTGHTAWKPRDSCGEMAYNGKLWLIGGWFQSYEDPPRDVWSSPDGATWKLENPNAAFRHSDLATTLVFDDKMWIMGGWHGGRLKHASASNEVCSSTDGVTWRQATKSAGWSPRLGAAGVVFQGKMWILGGVQKYYFGDDSDLRSDVWSSADGITWKQATAKAPWAPRAYHVAAAHAGKLWVYGGGNYLPHYAAHNDVWSSPDGVNWTRETAKAPWRPRAWFSGAVYRDRIWVLGGWAKETASPGKKPASPNMNDVWYSTDGKDWKELKTRTVWSPRHEHSTYVFQDRLWVAAGMTPPLNNDVWSLYIPPGWFRD